MNAARYIAVPAAGPLDLTAARQSIVEALQRDTEVVEGHVASDIGSDDRVYVGVGGIVLMNWHLSSLDIPEISVTDSMRGANERLNLIVSRSNLPRPSAGAKTSFLRTSVGLATLILLRHLSHLRSAATLPFPVVSEGLYSRRLWEKCARIINRAIWLSFTEHAQKAPEDGCDVLSGRAGLLYALLLLRDELTAFGSSSPVHDIVITVRRLASDRNISDVVDDIIRRGRAGSTDYSVHVAPGESVPPLVWSWHNKRYLGAAHGMAGTLQILISCPKHDISPHIHLIVRNLEWLVKIQDSIGNWPITAPRFPSRDHAPIDELVQWSHGAPGILILLSTTMQHRFLYDAVSPELRSSIATSLARGAELVYQYGFLRKGVGLSHGVGGSVFSLLAVSSVLDFPEQFSGPRQRRTGKMRASSSVYLDKAVHLALLATDWRSLTERGEMQLPDNAYGLYEGLAGMCCTWVAVLKIFFHEGRYPQNGIYHSWIIQMQAKDWVKWVVARRTRQERVLALLGSEILGNGMENCLFLAVNNDRSRFTIARTKLFNKV